MLIGAENRILRYSESLSSICDSLRYFLILLIIANRCYCAQQKKLDFNPDFLSFDISQQNTSGLTQFFRSQIPVKTLDKQNVTGIVSETTTSAAKHQNSRNESTEPIFLELPDDYADYRDSSLSHVAPEVLLDLEPGEMILSHEQASPGGRQKLVPDGFVAGQELELLKLHNFYRGNVTPPAADMSFMEWDKDLAQVAQDWANQCQFRHGFPPHSYPGVMGQNLYMGQDPTGVRALLLWYEEYQYYSLKTLECVPGKQCGHYTQMAWGESSLVGCGMKRCGFRRFFVVCHYSPPGNIVGNPPYVVGKPCSQCPLDHGGLCTNNLCVTPDQCSRNREDCDPACPLKCHNCGVLNPTTCKCSCPDGWDSLDCSRRCENTHESCGKNPGWPTAAACSMNHHAVANVYCRKMCGKCRDIENSISRDTCCNGVVCDHGYVLDRKHNLCQCRLLCPGPKCDDSEDNGSQYVSKNIYLILFAMIAQMTFLL